MKSIDVSKKHSVTLTYLLDEEVTMKRTIHSSHRMGKSFSDVRAPAGTPRFYAVRQCKGCGAEEIEHAAGQFTDVDLGKPCQMPKVMKVARKPLTKAKKPPKKAPHTQAITTRKHKKYNPERRAWRGRSYKKGGKRVADLKKWRPA